MVATTATLRFLLLTLPLAWKIQAHDFGLHGLTNENPTGNPLPLVPEISGPFRVMMRFNEISSPYHAIFHWTDQGASATPSSILFAYGTDGFGFWIDDAKNGNVECLDPDLPMIASNDVYKVDFSADGVALRVSVDGVEVVNCPSSVVPSSVSRVHFLAKSPGSTTTCTSGTADMLGAILGIMVVNTNDPPPHPRDLYRFWSFPSQVVRQPARLAASAYARFDSLGPRIWQRIFDFANGAARDNILCTQRAGSTDMCCRVFHGETGVVSTLDVPDIIVQNEWAFWHFEIDENATFTIHKDNQLAGTQTNTLGSPNGIFRTESHIGRSNFPSHENLQGVILGFRLDVF